MLMAYTWRNSKKSIQLHQLLHFRSIWKLQGLKFKVEHGGSLAMPADSEGPANEASETTSQALCLTGLEIRHPGAVSVRCNADAKVSWRDLQYLNTLAPLRPQHFSENASNRLQLCCCSNKHDIFLLQSQKKETYFKVQTQRAEEHLHRRSCLFS